MGGDIAQVAAQSGFSTTLFDLSEEMLSKAKIRIDKNLQSLVEKHKITVLDNQAIAGRIQLTTDIHDCVAGIIIEAISENPAAKMSLFKHLSDLNTNQAIFATNTSSLSVSSIAETIFHPQRVIGMHFFNPATIMKLVEVVNTRFTDAHTTRTIVELAGQMGKIPVQSRDVPGFIVNHVARPYYLEALRLIEQGLADAQTVDTLMESTGFKMGPFRLMDLIGNDINYAVSCSVFEALNRPERLKPSPVQEERVRKNELGRKTRKGYYDYP
jgi:3-hydroxybutyryl-CoA dehydrogenase